jgi:FAD/FMN-containing dehydrogenase
VVQCPDQLGTGDVHLRRKRPASELSTVDSSATAGASVPYRWISLAGASTRASCPRGAAPTSGRLLVRDGPAVRPCGRTAAVTACSAMPSGASLYFTVVCAQSEDPVAQWQHAKAAVNAAVVEAGGTISHHHGIGTEHGAGLADEVGPLMFDALRAVKRQVDPAGILNPGILVG